MEQRVNAVYRLMKKCGDGADGGVLGVYGSVNASSLVKILKSIHAHGHILVDLGAGDGRVMLAAMAVGADTALGFELPENTSSRCRSLECQQNRA
jgi:predicted RNA methylase